MRSRDIPLAGNVTNMASIGEDSTGSDLKSHGLKETLVFRHLVRCKTGYIFNYDYKHTKKYIKHTEWVALNVRTVT